MTLRLSCGTAIAAVVLGLVLAGCGSDTMTATTASPTTAATTSGSEAAPTTSAKASGPNFTIADYVRDNGFVETPVKRGDPGSPTIDLPLPPGWADAGPKTPDGAYAAIVFTDPAAAADPPTITALVFKLTGDVDPAKILEFASGEVKNLSGYEGGDGKPSTLGGFDAHQVGGAYTTNGVMRGRAQKTVVIPGQDGLYVLQINADALEEHMFAMIEATDVIDQRTTITP